jgi:sugar lactone lactonase YvrE
LWFSNWGADEIVAVDLDGNSEVVGRGPEGAGWAVNWLPDGRMLITGNELVRVEPDGSRVKHADLSHLSPYGWSEMTVDGRGNIYVNSINFDFADFDDVLTSGQAPGKIALVRPDGESREVAGGIAVPNGMVITSDNKTLVVAESFAARLTAFDVAEDGTLSNRRVWADGVGPDGICLDADGCIWASSGARTNDCAREPDRSTSPTHPRPASAGHNPIPQLTRAYITGTVGRSASSRCRSAGFPRPGSRPGVRSDVAPRDA